MRRLVAVALGLGIATASAGTLDRLAAVVNDDPIALSEVYDIGAGFILERCPDGGAPCLHAAELEVLDALIRVELQGQALVERDQAVTNEDVERAIDQIGRDAGIPDRPALRRAVESQGLGWDAFRENTRQQIAQMKFAEVVLRPRVILDEDEVRDRYNREKDRFVTAPKRKIEALAKRVPVGSTPEEEAALGAELAKVAAEVNAGSRDWVATVNELDDGTYKTKTPPGMMGQFEKGALMPLLDEPIFAATVGQVVGPVRVGDSFFLLRIVDEVTGAEQPFAEVADTLREEVYQRAMAEQAEQWYQQARRAASVRILLTAP